MTILESSHQPSSETSSVPHEARTGAAEPDQTSLAFVGRLHEVAMSLAACIALADHGAQNGYWDATAVIDQLIHDVRRVLITEHPSSQGPIVRLALLVDDSLASIARLINREAGLSTNDILDERLDQLRDQMAALTALVHATA